MKLTKKQENLISFVENMVKQGIISKEKAEGKIAEIKATSGRKVEMSTESMPVPKGFTDNKAYFVKNGVLLSLSTAERNEMKEETRYRNNTAYNINNIDDIKKGGE